MKSQFRVTCETEIRSVLEHARQARWPLLRLRRELRARHARLRVSASGSRSTWRRAFLAVTGHAIRALPDPRQLSLFTP
jgi:hypothetical protein